MSEEIEIACWRVWNFMRVHEKRKRDKIHSAVGIADEDYKEALDLLLKLDVLECDGEGFVRLVGDRKGIPPFTKVFETRE